MKTGSFMMIATCMMLQATATAQVCTVICNGGFDSVIVAPSGNVHVNSAQLTCWNTTSPDSLMEIWKSGTGGVASYSGAQFMEMNSFFPATIYQDVALNSGDQLSIEFAHRGRSGIDTMSVSVGPAGGPYTMMGYFGTDKTAWGFYSVVYPVPSTGLYSIRLNTVYWASGDPTIGNFLDAVEVCKVTGIAGPEPGSAFNVHPNPSEGFMTIDLDETSAGMVALAIFDMQGSLVYTAEGLAGAVHHADLRHLADGVYFLRIQSEKQSSARRLVLAR